MSSTRRHLFAEYRRDGLADHFRSALFSSDDIVRGLRDGSLVVDRRVATDLDALPT